MNFIDSPLYNISLDELLNHQEKLLKILKQSPKDKSVQSALKICENRIIILKDLEEENKKSLHNIIRNNGS